MILFSQPNDGNPSLTVRNDQIGVNARSIDDIIAYDQALLGTEAAHAKAAAYVAGLSNKDIKIGCSNVHYNYTKMTPSKANKYSQAVAILKAAGFTFIDNCMDVNPYTVVKRPYSNRYVHHPIFKHIYFKG
jgi:Asp-tRNA(Asn)/Glu-tRNA(Gln) amidotransferase A subunit family amidase